MFRFSIKENITRISKHSFERRRRQLTKREQREGTKMTQKCRNVNISLNKYGHKNLGFNVEADCSFAKKSLFEHFHSEDLLN